MSTASRGALILALLLPARATYGQAVSCQALYSDRAVTIQFARHARAASQVLLGRLEPEIVGVEKRIEEGVLAEMEGQPRPVIFREALGQLGDVRTAAEALDQALRTLESTHKLDRPLAMFDDALGKILRERPPGGRARNGMRHAHSAGTAQADPQPPGSLAEVLRRQREGLAELRAAWDALAEALRRGLPLAEQGKLSAAAFDGRAALFSKLQEAIEHWETYRQLFLETCRATLAATEQSYPTGLEWLEDRPGRLPPVP